MIYVRLNRWAKAAELQREALAEVGLDTLALDSTIVKFHAHGTGAPKKKDAKRSADRAARPRLERGGGALQAALRRGGERIPLALSFSSAQAADGPVGRALLRALGPV